MGTGPLSKDKLPVYDRFPDLPKDVDRWSPAEVAIMRTMATLEKLKRFGMRQEWTWVEIRLGTYPTMPGNVLLWLTAELACPCQTTERLEWLRFLPPSFRLDDEGFDLIVEELNRAATKHIRRHYNP